MPRFFIRLLSTEPIHRDLGILILRLGIGLSMMLFHGYGKISAGPETWERLGQNMQNLGIGFAPTAWGFMAALAEFGCSILLVLGVLFRPAAAMLAFTMLVAATRHLTLPPDQPGAGWQGASHALELLAVYLTLLFLGAGRYTLPSYLRARFSSAEHKGK